MSCFVTRPAKPLPGMREMSTLCSAAILRTSGVDLVRRRSSVVWTPPPPPSPSLRFTAGAGAVGAASLGAAGFGAGGGGSHLDASPFAGPAPAGTDHAPPPHV